MQTWSAITFSNGVDVNVGAVGAYLSSQTGFNTSTQISFTFVNNGYLCGTDAAYPNASRVVGE